MQARIVEMSPDHWTRVRDIYAEGLAGGEATFETAVPEWSDWDRAHLAEPRLVALAGGRPIGWAALTPVSERPVYAGVAAVGVYVDENHRGAGVGATLLSGLIRRSEDLGVWTLQAAIFPENAASLALHEACGFRRVGVRERLGKLSGRWRDVVLLERRSAVAGR